MQAQRSKTCSIDDCERSRVARGWCAYHYRRWWQYGDPRDITYPRGTIAERFWPKVICDLATGCWLWTGARLPNGYGLLGKGGKYGRPLKAHRVSWELHFGPIPDGLEVCHHCDNPPCVRPDHLFVGTRSDNMRDMHAKGRWAMLSTEGIRRGEAHHAVTRSDAVIAEICRRYASGGVTQRRLAAEYGVSQSAVSFWVRSVRRAGWRGKVGKFERVP